MRPQATMQHCFNCGEALGVYTKSHRDLDTCGKLDCLRAQRDAYREEDERAQQDAIEDDFGRYR